VNTYNGFGNAKKKRREKENRFRHFSEPTLFVTLVAKKKIGRLFSVTVRKRIRLSRISGLIVRLANEKLTYSGLYSYSGITQTNAPLKGLTILCTSSSSSSLIKYSRSWTLVPAPGHNSIGEKVVRFRFSSLSARHAAIHDHSVRCYNCWGKEGLLLEQGDYCWLESR